MYTLRIIEETRENEQTPFEQVIENFELGDSYAKIKNGTKDFYNIMSRYPNENLDNINYIICSQDGKEIFIEQDEKNIKYSYFIMTESGKTFEKL